MVMLWEELLNVLIVSEQSIDFLIFSPAYDKYKGVYYCAGYREGEQFIKCDSTFSREELPRVKPWNNNFELREEVRLKRT